MSITTKKLPSNIVNTRVEIVGINTSDCGCSCNKHKVCGGIVKEGTVIRLALASVVVDGVEEQAIEAVEIEGGCCIGFGKRHLIKHAVAYNGAICRVTEVLSKDSTSQIQRRLHYKYKGCAFAVIESFEGNEIEEANDDSDTDDTNNDGSDQDTQSSKKARKREK